MVSSSLELLTTPSTPKLLSYEITTYPSAASSLLLISEPSAGTAGYTLQTPGHGCCLSHGMALPSLTVLGDPGYCQAPLQTQRRFKQANSFFPSSHPTGVKCCPANTPSM